MQLWLRGLPPPRRREASECEEGCDENKETKRMTGALNPFNGHCYVLCVNLSRLQCGIINFRHCSSHDEALFCNQRLPCQTSENWGRPQIQPGPDLSGSSENPAVPPPGTTAVLATQVPLANCALSRSLARISQACKPTCQRPLGTESQASIRDGAGCGLSHG